MRLHVPLRHFAAATFLILHSLLGIAQQLPVIRAAKSSANIRVGNELQQGSWNINPSLKPDVFDIYVEPAGTPVTFITDQDSIRFLIKPDSYYDFVILVNGKDSALTAIKGFPFVPRAHFTDDYKKSHTGKTFVEVPPFYELVNIVFALTTEGRKDNGMIDKKIPYYTEVLQWFDKYRNEPVVERINADLKSPDGYHALKMDAYAFELSGEKVVKSPVYDRLGFSDGNNLQHQIAGLQDFGQKSNFSDFYAKHQPYYDRLIASYRDSIGVQEMQNWLTVNFPSTRYDSFKIIFSPLVSSNQSATRFDYDGFREAQAHVNFPRMDGIGSKEYSKKAFLVQAGSILFTELNHAFINPESEKPEYAARINKAFADLNVWNDMQKPAKYYADGYSSFNEYMNWALVCLRYADYAPKAEQGKLISRTEDMMVNLRGFKKFAAFDQFLVRLYKNRKKGQVLADLYPEIVSWFEKNA
ncbi:DUF4932 domain-containing protein [Dyadobacter aurulentus]|uniref:DUF4932 domain-containing protein n=1 Tax=Dyadobacter sp. UC 10 TaxID=2605428 RepID=UPI0011F30F18|nr:DUF4932 domain-containing protein [Dyadobacter sp. UC 10]KAA0993266.1 DUF4932 domain-containing protein [Dyadobacter sp. UC 10]